MFDHRRALDAPSYSFDSPNRKGTIVHKSIVVFEVEGGSDKFIDGHRKDTMPIVNAIKDAGWHAEVVYYRPEWAETLFEYISTKFDAYISRVNPGNIPGGEKGYFERN